MAINKGFIKDWTGNTILPITRGELVLDSDGNVALNSEKFLADDGHAGLVTAAERALLSGLGGSGSGQGISDIYTKLGLINNGLQFGGKTLNFYDASGTGTPINVISTGDGKIIIGNSTNTVNLSLDSLTTTGLSVTNILKSITVDKFGRVTAVSGAALLNEEIPEELSGKTISSSVLDGCTTSNKEIGSDEKAIANKAYVDAKFTEVTGVATGALKFGGALSTNALAMSALGNTKRNNHYYKVTASFDLNTSNLYDTTGIYGNTVTVQPGDTLIIYTAEGSTVQKFVYVPSGDDKTLLTVTSSGKAGGTGATALSSKMGDLTLRFDYPFSVKNADTVNNNSNTAIISMPYANAATDGYLSSSDWAEFKAYANNLAVSYTAEYTAGAGLYKIGTITVGTTPYVINGLNNISTLSIEDGAASGTNKEYNPILKFTETGVTTDVQIVLRGTKGIVVKKNGSAAEFAAANEVATDSTNYLEITSGYQFKVKLGSVVNNQVVHGLTDYEEFATFRSNVIQTTVQFEIITNSLKDSDNDYYYGSEDLKDAVDVTI